MQKSFWWWQCSGRYIISLSPYLHTPSFSPSLWFLWTSSTIFTYVYSRLAHRPYSALWFLWTLSTMFTYLPTAGSCKHEHKIVLDESYCNKVCVCVFARVRACLRACMSMCVRACVCVCNVCHANSLLVIWIALRSLSLLFSTWVVSTQLLCFVFVFCWFYSGPSSVFMLVLRFLNSLWLLIYYY